ncbi:MAG: nucleotidyltransferase family protein [Oscillospiraceae bacterium]
MKILGIVAEYNPFHNGHKLHIEESKKAISRDCAVVCVMSGDFVQRGEPAAFSKHARAEAAVRGGADLVFELPLPWALSSAEGFARGALGLLGGLGCVDYLSFGSECGDLNILNALATALLDPALDAAIREELETGIPYAAARQNALTRDIGQLAEQLEKPNNILAVEYLKAIYNQHLRIEPLTILRTGAGHDEPGSSAQAIRTLLQAGKTADHHMPREVAKVFHREEKLGRGPVSMENLENVIISRFRMLGEGDFNAVPDAAEGLGNRLFAAAAVEPTIDGILAAAKSKRYALSRIRRMSMCAALGLKAGQAQGTPPYARVLAANEKGRAALKLMGEKATIPIITKPAAVNELSPECKNLFKLESAAHDLYVLAYAAKEERRGQGDWRTSPQMLD